MVDIYEEFNEVLDSQMKSVSTKHRKNEAWKTIVRRHEARFPKTRRTVDELRIKISKIKSDAKDYLSKTKKSRAKTGGGPSSPNKIDAPTQKILDLCEDTPAFQGLVGVDSGEVEELSKLLTIASSFWL